MTAVDRCRAIAAFSEEPGVITRTFLSEAMRQCLDYLIAWAKQLGMSEVGVDAAGNFRALLTGSGGKRLVIGSHLDSIPNAGAFDGVLGVVLGMMIAESFRGQLPKCSLELVGFSEEEGVRFGHPFIGSTAFSQGLDERFLALADAGGVNIRQAIQSFGLDPQQVTRPLMNETAGYLEIHIEQGPVLESLGLPLGVVESIAGQTRATVNFVGTANHAGTTPMHLRRDAFCAAAEWTLAIERLAKEQAGLVATVGRVQIMPGAGNVVPGRATLSLDLRHAQDEVRENALLELRRVGAAIAAERGIGFELSVSVDQKTVPMNPDMIARVEQAVSASGAVVHRMASGAGHDAMIVASRVPAAMLFIRSPGGNSHHPSETVLAEDVEAALAAGRTFVENFN